MDAYIQNSVNTCIAKYFPPDQCQEKCNDVTNCILDLYNNHFVKLQGVPTEDEYIIMHRILKRLHYGGARKALGPDANPEYVYILSKLYKVIRMCLAYLVETNTDYKIRRRFYAFGRQLVIRK